MPPISSFFSNPSLTPATMFATSARASPCGPRPGRSSPARVMTSSLFSSRALRPAGTGCASLPFGPSARTVAPSIWTFTPDGILMGFLPIRDIGCPSPHVGEDFAADLLLACVPAGDDAPRRRHERHTHPAQDRRDVILRHVHAAPGRRDPHQTRDDLLVARPVLEADAQRPLLRVLEHPEVLDEALVLQDLGDPHLATRRRDVHLLVLRTARVAAPRPPVV